MNSVMMPAGRYYIGDLCYVMHGEWDEVCNLLNDEFDNMEKVGFELADGRKFACLATKYGDGSYCVTKMDDYLCMVGVDSGTIGCIKIDEVDILNLDNRPSLGAIVDFPNDFLVMYGNGGRLWFGDILIETGNLLDPLLDEEEY
jgi:hypothetical protein